jgi:hypothetical protein
MIRRATEPCSETTLEPAPGTVPTPLRSSSRLLRARRDVGGGEEPPVLLLMGLEPRPPPAPSGGTTSAGAGTGAGTGGEDEGEVEGEGGSGSGREGVVACAAVGPTPPTPGRACDGASTVAGVVGGLLRDVKELVSLDATRRVKLGDLRACQGRRVREGEEGWEGAIEHRGCTGQQHALHARILAESMCTGQATTHTIGGAQGKSTHH